jgi:hypothetical protein
MNKTFISKTTVLAKRAQKAHEQWCDLEVRFSELKRECDHRTPDGKLWLKTKRQPKRGSQRACTYKVCGICGQDVFNDCYGRPVSVWNHLDIPEEEKRRVEEIMGLGKKLLAKTK